jgi:hypothetical protein
MSSLLTCGWLSIECYKGRYNTLCRAHLAWQSGLSHSPTCSGLTRPVTLKTSLGNFDDAVLSLPYKDTPTHWGPHVATADATAGLQIIGVLPMEVLLGVVLLLNALTALVNAFRK